MATHMELTEDEIVKLMRQARITKPELSDRLGHWVNAAQRWGANPPRYVVAYLELRRNIFDLVAHIEFGTVPKDFSFLAALKEMNIKKTELGRITGVTKHTVTRWGDTPPLYILEYVYCRYLLEKCPHGTATEPEPTEEPAPTAPE